MQRTFFLSLLAASIQGIALEQTESAYGTLLAQIFNNVDYDKCMVVSDRARESELSYEAMKDTLKSKRKFDDKAFPKSKDALLWPGERLDPSGMPKQEYIDSMQWVRLSEKSPESSLFGS